MKLLKLFLGILGSLLVMQMVANAGDVLPDLVVSSLSFQEYNQSINNTNMTFVNVTAVIKNIGNATAGNSTARFNGLSQFNEFTPPIAPGIGNSISVVYACTAQHDVTVLADVFNVVIEKNEDNNGALQNIDCII